MPGKNLTYSYKIRTQQDEKHIAEQDFPLIIGGSSQADITVLGLREHEEAAYIGFSQGHPFVQPGKADIPISYNDVELKESVWLFHDDILQIGSLQILFQVQNDTVIFEVSAPDTSKPDHAKESVIMTPDRAEPASISEEAIPRLTAHEIEPIRFRTSLQRDKVKMPLYQRLLWLTFILILLLLASALVWLNRTYNRVYIEIEPKPDSFNITEKGAILSWENLYLLKPGTYTLKAKLKGYHPFEHIITVSREKKQLFRFTLEKLPGFLTVTAHKQGSPSSLIKGAQVFINGKIVGKTPVEKAEVKAGMADVEIRARQYHDKEKKIDIMGKGEIQSLTFELETALGNVTIRSEPKGADVLVNGRGKGKTPLNIDLPPGTYQLKLSAHHYKSHKQRFVVKANKPLVLDTIQLERKKAKLSISSTPSDATVTVDNKYIGQTPLNVSLSPDETHTVLLSKSGYEKVERQIRLSSQDKEKISVLLVPIKGIIRLNVEPYDAELFVDGKSQGSVKKELNLTAVEHEIEIRKKGYKSYKRKITPDPKFVKEFKISLTSEAQKSTEPQTKKSVSFKGIIRASNGYRLILIEPSAFTMGSSRRQQGRRSNETLRNILLKRPFYMGTQEVTNREFRQFQGTHYSGDFKGYSLNRDEQPVVQVTWQQAAEFCNWLSKKDSLPPAYVQRNGRLVAASPLTIGYRLCTEAEWEYAARLRGNTATLKYPWGEIFPPHEVTLNIADKSASTLLSAVLNTYDDGFPASAPAGVFKPNSLGIYDMGGNVAEWCHDFYTIYPFDTKKTYTDPAGPDKGKHRVVRGSSWKQSSISMLRTTYRDYYSDKREDLGFRICRYGSN